MTKKQEKQLGVYLQKCGIDFELKNDIEKIEGIGFPPNVIDNLIVGQHITFHIRPQTVRDPLQRIRNFLNYLHKKGLI